MPKSPIVTISVNQVADISMKKPKEKPVQEAPEAKAEVIMPLSGTSASCDREAAQSREDKFKELFMMKTTYLRPQVKFLMVEIDPVFIGKIKRLIAFECGNCSLKSYINNVLAAHFDEYADVINPKL